MKIIRTTEVLSEAGFPNAPYMWQSSHVAVFSPEFIENEWTTFWNGYRASSDGSGGKLIAYPRGAGVCEDFAQTAIAFLKKTVRLALGGVDAVAGAYEIRIRIPDGITFNRIPGPSGHSTVLLVVKSAKEPTDIPDAAGEILESGVAGEPSYIVTTGGFELMFWEPQTGEWIHWKEDNEIEISDLIL